MKIVLDVSEYQSTAQLDNLLRNADDEVVGVYIKATQDLDYRDDLAAALAKVCLKHNTPFGYYDFLTNAGCADQAQYFSAFVSSLPKPSLKPMMDAEGAYDKWAQGALNWQTAFGKDAVLYAQLSNMPHYIGSDLPLWVAQYDSMDYYRPAQSEIDTYTQQGYILWQWTSCYLGLSQDASVLLGDFNMLRL